MSLGESYVSMEAGRGISYSQLLATEKQVLIFASRLMQKEIGKAAETDLLSTDKVLADRQTIASDDAAAVPDNCYRLSSIQPELATWACRNNRHLAAAVGRGADRQRGLPDAPASPAVQTIINNVSNVQN